MKTAILLTQVVLKQQLAHFSLLYTLNHSASSRRCGIHDSYSQFHDILVNFTIYLIYAWQMAPVIAKQSDCRNVLHHQFFLVGYVGLIWHSTAEVTASRSTLEDTLRVCCSYCMHDTADIIVSAYPKSSPNSTITYNLQLSGTASYETYIASQKNLNQALS